MEESQVNFYLFKNFQTFLQINGSNVLNSVDKTAEIVFLIHGWTENREKQWYEDLKNAFFSRDDKHYNLIQVDWSAAAGLAYHKAVGEIKNVGKFPIKNHVITL